MPRSLFAPRLALLATGLSALLLGCATTTSPDLQDARTSIWVRENVASTMESDPVGAAEKLLSRFRATCTDGATLGTRSFYAQFKDTERYPDYTTCRILNGNLAAAYWKAGNHAALGPHLMQVLWDGFNSPRQNYGETWCSRHIGWSIYTGVNWFDHKTPLPPWYDMHAVALPKAAADVRLLHKRYFCTLEAAPGSATLPVIKASIEQQLGKQAANDLDRYATEILQPIKNTEGTILQRNVSKESTEFLRAASIEKLALYKNALQHLQRMGLDKVSYSGDPVFVSHLNSLISEEQVSLQRYSR